MAGTAAYEHRVDVRIRLACRVLASMAHLQRASGSRHGLWRCDGACEKSERRRSDERGKLGDRKPRSEVDRLQGFYRARRTKAHGGSHPDSYAINGCATSWMVHRPKLGQHAQG